MLNKLQHFAAAFLPAVFGRNNVAEGGLKRAAAVRCWGHCPSASPPMPPLQRQLVHLVDRATTKIQLLEYPSPLLLLYQPSRIGSRIGYWIGSRIGSQIGSDLRSNPKNKVFRYIFGHGDKDCQKNDQINNLLNPVEQVCL